jgi:hypothetical protein
LLSESLLIADMTDVVAAAADDNRVDCFLAVSLERHFPNKLKPKP